MRPGRQHHVQIALHIVFTVKLPMLAETIQELFGEPEVESIFPGFKTLLNVGPRSHPRLFHTVHDIRFLRKGIIALLGHTVAGMYIIRRLVFI